MIFCINLEQHNVIRLNEMTFFWRNIVLRGFFHQQDPYFLYEVIEVYKLNIDLIGKNLGFKVLSKMRPELRYEVTLT